MNLRVEERVGGLTVIAEDSAGKELFRSTAEWRAEVHVSATQELPPLATWELFKAVHERMEQEMRMRGVSEVVTWFPTEETFCKRLRSLGWQRSSMIPYVREVKLG